MSIAEEIQRLKEEKHAVILAHYYVPDEVQAIADCVGDSFFLAKKAKETDAEIIVFCGVSFMGESAKILNPGKKVLMPDKDADCAMAHMVTVEKIMEMREKYEDLAVVCYINSTAEIKTVSDVCVTSSNAVKIMQRIPNKNVFFVPDGNLGRHVAKFVPEKNVICNDGYCPVHREITADLVKAAKKNYPNAEFLVHPECTQDVLELADFIGSTSEIIQYASKSEGTEFLIGTEMGVSYQLELENPQKKFYPVMDVQCCKDMKLVTLEKVRDALTEEKYEVCVPEDVRVKAWEPLQRMLDMAK